VNTKIAPKNMPYFYETEALRARITKWRNVLRIVGITPTYVGPTAKAPQLEAHEQQLREMVRQYFVTEFSND
jgi:hypothetical protein